MNIFKKFFAVTLGAVLFGGCIALSACGKAPSPFKPKTDYDVSSDSLYVKKVENLPDGFIMGMDSSSVISLEKSGVKYYDYDGSEKDVFEVLSMNGINYIRVRVWNDPYDKDGNGYGGGNCDIDNAVEIGKRASKYGMNLLVDFHYSDFWADPAKQMVPKAWKNMGIDERIDAIYDYTKESLKKLTSAGVHVGMVQLGNETNGAMCGISRFATVLRLMEAGSKAVREVTPKALVAVHFANPEKITNYRDYAKQLNDYNLDYDVFGSSYYSYWHGTLNNLSTLLSEIATTYNKKVMIMETSYAYTAEDSDFNGNTIGAGSAVTKNYPYTVQGQANAVRDVIDTVAHTTNGIGVCYWEGTWISVGTSSWEENSAKWEKYGSGWASSYATEYDPDDAGKYYGGCAVDNQAFFDPAGKPLESLKTFALVRSGNTVENKADALEDVTIICDLNGEIKLPDKVNAIMLDDSKTPLPVTWNITDDDIQKMYNGGVDKYEYTGTAGGMTAHCYISMVEYNFLNNYSFEEDGNGTPVPTGWTVNAIKTSNELYVENKDTDSITGSQHFHFWSEKANTVEFELEQELKDLKAGKYKFAMSIMGDKGGESDIYIYVKINDNIVYKSAQLKLTGYNKWNTELIENIEYNGTDKIVAGIYVKCPGAGAWGKIEDALFNSVTE